MPSTIRPASPADAAQLAILHTATFDDPWSEGDLYALLTAPGGFALLADDGFAVSRVAADEAELVSLGVLPTARRTGLGRALLAAVMARAEALGGLQMHLEVAVDNPGALALYEGMGFAQAGRRRAYYARRDGRVDALVLTCVLNSGSASAYLGDRRPHGPS